MKERPIIFSGAMVRALLAGTKTQTRRVVKPLPITLNRDTNSLEVDDENIANGRFAKQVPCPYGQPGDRLWVREAHWWFKDEPDHETGYYPPKLTVEDVEYRADGDDVRKVWRPSIFMPRWASRITLEVTSVRVERLQDISRGDAMAEGCPFPNLAQGDDPRRWYAHLWDEIHGEGSVEANPWVWVVEFRSVEVAAK